MLDLAFVRANLELVEEKLRARGADPAALLGDFRALDEGRRDAITIAEQIKARCNRLSQQVGALKKAKQDASALMEEIRAIKETLEADKDRSRRLRRADAPVLVRHPQPHPRRSPHRQIRSRQRHRKNLGR